MNRARNASAQPMPTIVSRMSLAVAMSAALHVCLILGVTSPGPRTDPTHLTAIEARLQPAVIPVQSAQRPVRPLIARSPGQAPLQEQSQPAVMRTQPIAEPAAPATDTQPPPLATADVQTPPPEPDVALADLPDLVHYGVKDLDVYPRPVTPVTPAVAAAARDAQVSGSVTLLLLIDESGRVVGTSVIDAAPEGVFEQSAQNAWSRVTFHPAQKNGRHVRSRVLIKVDFEGEAGQGADDRPSGPPEQ